jgi:hypothetical protein
MPSCRETNQIPSKACKGFEQKILLCATLEYTAGNVGLVCERWICCPSARTTEFNLLAHRHYSDCYCKFGPHLMPPRHLTTKTQFQTQLSDLCHFDNA